MDKINKSFKYNNCTIEIKFTSSDKYGADRHYIFLNKAMLPTLKEQCFKKSENEITEYAKQLTNLMTCTC